ncbi:MAG: hypothetical protein ABSD59_08710 [Terracidiphilus sp.]
MPVSRAMRRLLQVLEIQEEECRAAMELARAEFERLQQALTQSRERERGGRRLVAASAATGEVTDRIAGLEETRAGTRVARALTPRIVEADEVVNERRSEFLGKRIERLQTETLIKEAEAQDRIEAERSAQRELDSWFLNRRDTSRKKPREE